jgi:signal transduction histidine kinase
VRIRSQLLLLVVAAIAPIALLAAILLSQVWELQRDAYRQRFQERVSALRLALDAEISGAIRTLEALAPTGDLSAPQLNALAVRLERVLASHSNFATAGALRPDGDLLLRRDALRLPANIIPDRATINQAATTRAPAVSNLVRHDGSSLLMTYIVVPVMRGNDVVALMYAGIENAGWLEFLERLPIDPGATLTLNDREGAILARTLNNETWAGKRSSPGFWSRTEGKSEATFVSAGLEGQRFYTSFSRLRSAGWIVGTGVLEDTVESSLRIPTLMIFIGTIGALAAALAFAVFLGRRIASGLTGLAAAAETVGTAGRRRAPRTLGIAEADVVNNALDKASELLVAREQSLKQAAEVAESANRAKDEFIAMLGHELRNPLNAIGTATSIMDNPRKTGDMDVNARAILRRQVRYLSGIVDDLLDIARLTSGKIVLHKTPLDLAAIVEQVLAEFERSGRSAHLTVKRDLVPAPIVADETRVAQVVSNLLDNACKYTPPGGTITVTLRRLLHDVELRVSDDGVGIPENSLGSVFDVFSQNRGTLHHAQGGLGLGLAIVRRLVSLHEGTVRADSAGTGKGSAFTVALPLTPPSEAATRADATAPELPPLRIVVVDDMPDNRDSMSLLLGIKGHAVRVAGSGPEGLATIAEERPDVALIDIGLPGFDGCELARRVRARFELGHPMLVALTGYGNGADRDRALEAGFDAYIVKPFSFEAFVKTVAHVQPRPH